MGFGDRLSLAVKEKKNAVCVGIDPRLNQLPRILTQGVQDEQGAADAFLAFSKKIIDVVAPLVPVVKPQSAFFEELGPLGVVALREVNRYATSKGLLVILDGKRNDIGSTATAYARAYMGQNSPFGADALTVSPYQGFDALEPAFSRAASFGSTVFILCATSNPDAKDLQRASLAGSSLPAIVARYAKERAGDTNTVGVVVGATRDVAEAGLSADDLAGLLVLAPGFGAQGASLTDIRKIFGTATPRVIPSVSRSVIRSGLAGVGASIDEHLRELGL
jgi:orotidine-5'-phosphate decarboxylase